MVLTIATIPYQATSATLGSFDVGSTFGARDIFDQGRLIVGFGGDPVLVIPDAVVFDLILSEDDVGKTFMVSSGTEFDEAVALMTNGVDDIVIEFGLLAGEVNLESITFFGDPTGASGIDFAGSTIESISLTVNNLTFNTPGSDPNGDGIWTEVDFNSTVRVNGVVPIPAAIWLFGTGLIGLIGLARREASDLFRI